MRAPAYSPDSGDSVHPRIGVLPIGAVTTAAGQIEQLVDGPVPVRAVDAEKDRLAPRDRARHRIFGELLFHVDSYSPRNGAAPAAKTEMSLAPLGAAYTRCGPGERNPIDCKRLQSNASRARRVAPEAPPGAPARYAGERTGPGRSGSLVCEVGLFNQRGCDGAENS